MQDAQPFSGIIGSSSVMRKVFQTIEQVASTDVDVLIHGETGTGKELAARATHERSNRRESRFVAVDCGAIPPNLMESEFFGYERGAFTGADAQRIGLMEFADGGTLFLDEVGELPLLLQAKLLRTLQERRFRRVGGYDEIRTDVRVIAATARRLDEMVQQKTFRDDLYYRINVVRIDLPPLRDRGDDLGLLSEYFADRYSREMQRPIVGISPESYQVFRQYDWPGNIRELQNMIRRGIALTEDTLIGLNDLPDDLITSAGDKTPSTSADTSLGFFQAREEHVARFERDYITSLLKLVEGNVSAAAKKAKIPRGTLHRLMKNHNIESNDFR